MKPIVNMLFISYSRKDAEFAQKIGIDLRRHGITTWIDEVGIRGGDEWSERIAMALELSGAVLLIISPASLASKWVKRELAFADQNEKPVLPLLYKSCEIPSWFDLRFGHVQRSEFSQGRYRENLLRLIESIDQVLGPRVNRKN